jgi:hypothetical protein
VGVVSIAIPEGPVMKKKTTAKKTTAKAKPMKAKGKR